MLSTVSIAEAETRTLKLFFIHTKEKAEITFKRNGRYDAGGLQKINRFLRDWRRNEPTKIDPRLLDLVWEAYRAAGGRDYIHVVSAYRSPATNSMLRKRSKGVANKSQHMLGKAMDFYVPGVRLATLRAAALKLGGGGVGYYPSSGSPFVHMDVGTVRHWPRMNRSQLLAVFPNGNTMHVPTDGKPLPGYNQALASYQSRKRSGGSIAIASAERKGGFLSALFGGGADEAEEESGEVAVIASADPDRAGSGVGRGQKPRQTRQADDADTTATTPRTTRQRPRETTPLPGITPAAKPEPQLAAPPVVVEEPRQVTPETIIAALPQRAVPLPLAAPRPKVDVEPVTVAAADVGATDVGALALTPEPVVGEAVADAAAAPAEAEIALRVPLPTRRPSTEADQPLVATVELPNDGPLAALAPRTTTTGQMAIEDVLAEASMPVPGTRPTLEAAPVVEAVPPAEENIIEPIEVAALPQARPATEPRASQRSAMLSGDEAESAKTTAKSSRPGPRDRKPEAKPVVVPTEPDDARWAFDKDYVINAKRSSTAPSFAYNLVRTAPREVLTAGFEQSPRIADPSRFSGKAVTFLAVAKFEGGARGRGNGSSDALTISVP